MKIEIGAKIKALRESKKMTQKELAETLKISRETISKWELDKSLPDIENLIRLSDIFQISVDELLGRPPKAKSWLPQFLQGRNPKMNQSKPKNPLVGHDTIILIDKAYPLKEFSAYPELAKLATHWTANHLQNHYLRFNTELDCEELTEAIRFAGPMYLPLM